LTKRAAVNPRFADLSRIKIYSRFCISFEDRNVSSVACASANDARTRHLCVEALSAAAEAQRGARAAKFMISSRSSDEGDRVGEKRGLSLDGWMIQSGGCDGCGNS
jgi:hypothetical protein